MCVCVRECLNVELRGGCVRLYVCVEAHIVRESSANMYSIMQRIRSDAIECMVFVLHACAAECWLLTMVRNNNKILKTMQWY